MDHSKKAGKHIEKGLPASVKQKVLKTIGHIEQIETNRASSETINFQTIHFPKLKDRSKIYICDIEDLLENPQYFEPNKTDFYTIYLYESGQGIYSVGADEIFIKRNHILFVPPQKVHQFYEPVDYKGKALLFESSVFTDDTVTSSFLYQTTIFNNGGTVVYLSLKNRDESIKNLFKAIQEELEQPFTPTRSQILTNYLFNILLISSELIDPADNPWNQDNKLRLINDFKKLVYKEKNKNKTLKYYTSRLNVNGLSLEKAFKKHEQTTPKKWLIHIIILEIKQELRYSRQSISEIAFKYGFSDVSNFTKYFKKHTGITPTEFRKDPLKYIF
ncbi:MAG TPA: helix-turn-helix transcriptional regulator [Flavobacterium sp.]|nr:helix-turn-helix transcriptional regulator [Flavobacterium sp.]